jgi:carbon storage regulator
MLVLSRTVGESICIDGRIEIMVTQIGRKRIKLGVLAPIETRVMRGELIGRPFAAEPKPNRARKVRGGVH